MQLPDTVSLKVVEDMMETTHQEALLVDIDGKIKEEVRVKSTSTYLKYPKILKL